MLSQQHNCPQITPVANGTPEYDHYGCITGYIVKSNGGSSGSSSGSTSGSMISGGSSTSISGGSSSVSTLG